VRRRFVGGKGFLAIGASGEMIRYIASGSGKTPAPPVSYRWIVLPRVPSCIIRFPLEAARLVALPGRPGKERLPALQFHL